MGKMKYEEIAKFKLKIMEMLISDPKITDAALARALKINRRTCKKYREEILNRKENKLNEIVESIQKMGNKAGGGIWEKIKNLGK